MSQSHPAPAGALAASACLYDGYVEHRRFRPKTHRLRYRLFSLFIDIDRIDEVDSALWCFSRNRWNLFSFYDSDFGVFTGADQPVQSGAKTPGMLRRFVERELSDAGIPVVPECISLLCSPRMLGYAFNPLSVFLCYRGGSVIAVVYEVHNTFGERFAYVLGADSVVDSVADQVQPDGTGTAVLRQSCLKSMHVSPFTPRAMLYRFFMRPPTESVALGIQAVDGNGVVLTANFNGKAAPLTASGLVYRLASYPLMTLKVIVGIHYEALKLWLKRVPWYKHSPADPPGTRPADTDALVEPRSLAGYD